MTNVETDIWRSAEFLVAQHGDEAQFYAETMLIMMARRCDLDGEERWTRISRAITKILSSRQVSVDVLPERFEAGSV
jgi:hypothetical protein